MPAQSSVLPVFSQCTKGDTGSKDEAGPGGATGYVACSGAEEMGLEEYMKGGEALRAPMAYEGQR